MIQEGKLKKPFRYLTTFRGQKEKWVRGDLRSDWYYIYKYEADGTYFGIYEDVYGNVKKKLTHQECDAFFVM